MHWPGLQPLGWWWRFFFPQELLEQTEIKIQWRANKPNGRLNLYVIATESEFFPNFPTKAPNQPCAKGTLPALSARHQSPPAMVSRWCSKRKDFFWFKAINSKAEKIRKGVCIYIYICYIIFIYVSKWSLDTPAIQPPWEVTLSSSWQCHPTSGRPPSWWNWEATHKNHTQPISTNCPSSNKNQHLKDSTHFTCEFCCTTCYCESICLGIPDSSLHVLHASMWEYAGSYHAMEYHHWGYACHATDLLPNSSPGPIQRHSDYKNAETIWQWRTAPSRNSYKPPKRANWNQFHLPRLSVPLLLFSWSLNIDRVTWRKPFFLVPRAVLKFTKLAPSRTTHLTQKNITSLSRYSLKQHYQLNVVFFPWPFISTSHQSFPLQVTHLGRFRRFRRFRCRRHLRCQRHRWTAWRLFSHRPAACWVAVSIEET